MTATRSSTDAPPRRELRTTKKRGRTTPRQQRSLDTLSSRYGVGAASGRIDPAALFGRSAPLVLEVGFGMGEATVAMAAADPGRDVLAVDLHLPGVGALLHEVAALGLGNVRVAHGDARALLRDHLGAGGLDEVRVFFPDPWPKARHHKRRLVDAGFASLVASRLVVGGRLHVATDWEPYARQVRAVVEGEPLLELRPQPGRPPWRAFTRYEHRGLVRGHAVADVVAVRLARPQAPGGPVSAP